MITITLCMIVKNEQDSLERCLQSVRDAVDEIIILDTGSTDKTKEIAGKWTPHVYSFAWIDDFAAARNFSFAQATMDYILWLDADDILLPAECQKLSLLKQSMSPTVDTVSMQYHSDFDDCGNVTLNVRRIRLVKRSMNYQWEGAAHEDLIIKGGTTIDTDIIVIHMKNHSTSDPNRDIKIYENLLSKGKEFTHRDTLHYAMELHQHKFYKKATEFYLKFMEMEDIMSEDRIYACTKLADCYYYLEEREKEREYIFKSFEYDIPHPEFCCRLGYYFLEKSQYSQAVFWYKLATELPIPNNHWAIQNQPSRTWLPHMQLGLCYYQLGDYKQSYRHNKMVLYYRPNDQSIVSNVKLLEELMKKEQPLKTFRCL